MLAIYVQHESRQLHPVLTNASLDCRGKNFQRPPCVVGSNCSSLLLLACLSLPQPGWFLLASSPHFRSFAAQIFNSCREEPTACNTRLNAALETLWISPRKGRMPRPLHCYGVFVMCVPSRQEARRTRHDRPAGGSVI